MVPVGDTDMKAPQALADRIADAVNKKFTELLTGVSPQFSRRKVLAGIVMTSPSKTPREEESDGEDNVDMNVITVATGTKCINGEFMSEAGLTLNDCHAEVLARRCLRRFLYSQLQLILANSQDESVFTPRGSGLSGFRLKDGVNFHLYVSTSPCGDARIFSPHEHVPAKENGHSDSPSDKHPNRRARGLLRTKIESGEGTIPVKQGPGIQTWDGILQGERLLIMSCSDKISRWNVLGMQGEKVFT